MRVDLLLDESFDPGRLARPEIGIEDILHLIPLERLLEEADVIPLRDGVGEIEEGRIAVPYCVEGVVALLGQQGDAVLLELGSDGGDVDCRRRPEG